MQDINNHVDTFSDVMNAVKVKIIQHQFGFHINNFTG